MLKTVIAILSHVGRFYMKSLNTNEEMLSLFAGLETANEQVLTARPPRAGMRYTRASKHLPFTGRCV